MTLEATATTVVKVAIANIRLDGSTQSRVAMNQDVIDDYAEKMKAGAKFPAIHLFFDPTLGEPEKYQYFIGDGNHRVRAAIQAELEFIDAELHTGSERAAMLYSFGSNGDHGMGRSTADIDFSIKRMLLDPEWVTWSDRAIADKIKLNHHDRVSKMRKAMVLSGEIRQIDERRYERGGQTHTMKTANIGTNGHSDPVRSVMVMCYDEMGNDTFPVEIDAETADWWAPTYFEIAKEMPEAIVFAKYSLGVPNQVYVAVGDNANLVAHTLGVATVTAEIEEERRFPIVALSDHEFHVEGRNQQLVATGYSVLIMDGDERLGEQPAVQEALERQRQSKPGTKQLTDQPEWLAGWDREKNRDPDAYVAVRYGLEEYLFFNADAIGLASALGASVAQSPLLAGMPVFKLRGRWASDIKAFLKGRGFKVHDVSFYGRDREFRAIAETVGMVDIRRLPDVPVDWYQMWQRSKQQDPNKLVFLTVGENHTQWIAIEKDARTLAKALGVKVTPIERLEYGGPKQTPFKHPIDAIRLWIHGDKRVEQLKILLGGTELVCIESADSELKMYADRLPTAELPKPAEDVPPYELYTPAWLVDLIREALGGGIGLDPASCIEAQKTVQADYYYTVKDDGLKQSWEADSVFVNPPYGREFNKPWAIKIREEYESGRADHMIALLPSSPSAEWYQLFSEYPRLELNSRVDFYGPANKDLGARFDSVLILMGVDLDHVAQVFTGKGDIYVRYAGS